VSVYRHQGKWRYEFMIGGVRYRDSGYETKQAARDAEAEERRNLKRTNLDFLRLCKSRLRDLRINRTRKYLEENKKLVKNLIKRWGRQRTITKTDVLEYVQAVAEKRGAFVANKELRFIRALFNHGITLEWFVYNPCTGIKPFSIKERKRRYVPPEEDVKKILNRASSRQRAYLLAAIHTLGRSSSINNLKWSDVHESHLILRTRKAKNSNEKEISIPINQVLREALDKIPHDGEYVFVKKTGAKFEYRDKIVPSLCRKAKVPRFTLHCLRHFGASKLDNAGVPLCDIQELLGHEQATTTAIYLQSLRGSTIEAVKKLEDLK